MLHLSETNLTFDKISTDMNCNILFVLEQVHSPTTPSSSLLSVQLPHWLHHVLCEDAEGAGRGSDWLSHVSVVDGGSFCPRHWIERSEANTSKGAGMIDFHKTLFYAH